MEATNPDVVPASPSSSPRAEHNVGVEDCETGIAVQTDLKMGDIEALENECVALNERLYASRTENKLLELTEDALKCSDAKVVFYTGMENFRILYALFNVLERYTMLCGLH
ncbi:uncharacterized protein LOC144129703 [Amblyomma americanum]